jgi:hypothetical protein
MFKAILALVLGLALSTSALAQDKAYYEIKKVTVKDVTAQYATYMDLFSQPGLSEQCAAAGSTKLNGVFAGQVGSLNPLDTINVVVDQIINIGKKIWNIVEAGKPVVDLKMDTANALPMGVTCWSDLSGWNMPNSKVFNVEYTNGFGMSVVNFAYRVTFTAKGSVNGVGQYITNATFMPANVHVAWGYNFAASAEVPSVFNQGTKEAPLAGMQMNMKWNVSTVVVNNVQSESYFVSGDNNLVHLE